MPDLELPPEAKAARVALLGEMTHGTADFYEARAELTIALAEEGATILALEADWPDASAADAYVRGRSDSLQKWHSYARWPTWMWRNTAFESSLDRLRDWNAGRDEKDQVMVCGLDLYSLPDSITAVIQYLDQEDPEAAEAARNRYGCLARWQDDPSEYGAAVRARLEDCRNDVVEVLRDLLRQRLDGHDLFDAQQNARVVAGAESYYRSVYDARLSSWNVRDGHMMETLDYVLRHRGPDSKAVVWAHNSHVGDARGSEMGAMGETTLGTLCRKAHRSWTMGAFTDTGTVMAAHQWGQEPEIMALRPSRPDSHSAWLKQGPQGLRTELDDEARLERAIGVIYRPNTERMSHYFQSRLDRRYDAVLWAPNTRAVVPVNVPVAPVEPELWPSAL